MLFRNEVVNTVLEKEANESHKWRAEVDLKLSFITEDTLRNKKSAYISKKQNAITPDNKKEILNIMNNFDEAHKGLEDKIKRESLMQEEKFLAEKAKRRQRTSSRRVISTRESVEGGDQSKDIFGGETRGSLGALANANGADNRDPASKEEKKRLIPFGLPKKDGRLPPSKELGKDE